MQIVRVRKSSFCAYLCLETNFTFLPKEVPLFLLRQFLKCPKEKKLLQKCIRILDQYFLGKNLTHPVLQSPCKPTPPISLKTTAILGPLTATHKKCGCTRCLSIITMNHNFRGGIMKFFKFRS